MPKPTAIARSRSTAPLLALVLGLHAVVLLSLANLGAWRDRGGQSAERPPLQVWLLDALKPEPQPQSQPAAVPSPTAPQAAAARRAETTRQPVLPGETQAITLPAPPEAAAAPAPLETAATTASPAPSTPLNLALPRSASAPWRQRGLAADDPRSNTRRPVNMATLIGRALSDDASEAITEERLEDGSVRFRRGNRCLIVHPSQTQTLNPFNSSFSPKPGTVDSC